MVIIIVIFMY